MSPSCFSLAHCKLPPFCLDIPNYSLLLLEPSKSTSLTALCSFSVTVVSVLRLQSLIYLARSSNPTWDQWLVAWWSTIEVHVGMICTCLPTLRLILVRIYPRVFSTLSSRNKLTSDRPTRPNSSNYIMQGKDITLEYIEIAVGAASSTRTDTSKLPSYVAALALAERRLSKY